VWDWRSGRLVSAQSERHYARKRANARHATGEENPAQAPPSETRAAVSRAERPAFLQLSEDHDRRNPFRRAAQLGGRCPVTQAQTDLETADNKYIQSLYDALVSKVDLDKAYGKIQ